MKIRTLSLLWLLRVSNLGAAESVVLTCDSPITWKSVFDAGFRPIHVRDGTDKCRQLDVNLSIRLSETGELVNLGRGDAEFSLRDDHLLVLMAFYGREHRTVKEVEAKSAAFARIFEGYVTGKSKIR